METKQAENTTQPQEIPKLTALVLEKFPGRVTARHTCLGDETITIPREGMLEVFAFLRDDKHCRFNLMVDLTAVDYLGLRETRFELVVHLKSLALGHRLRVKIPVPAEDPSVDSLINLWGAVDWYERECFDMYGLIFKNHPNLKRLILYDSFVGHPLRKDYPIHLQQPRVTLRPVRERYDYMCRVMKDPSETEQPPL
ncbi:MAG: NADH-quinone oxidoreductase subunit C [Deltaproteobacteria bacterium]|nr:NADH-quinone oxidoreductase subunit C [Deltaproteobacteria bacterium]